MMIIQVEVFIWVALLIGLGLHLLELTLFLIYNGQVERLFGYRLRDVLLVTANIDFFGMSVDTKACSALKIGLSACLFGGHG